MQAFQSYLEKMGENFLVSALIPSLTFVTLSMVAFARLIPAEWVQALANNLAPTNILFDQPWLLLALLAIVLGFTLSSLNTYIYKLFEGYAFLRHFPILTRRQIKRARQLKAQIKYLERRRNRRKVRFEQQPTKFGQIYEKQLDQQWCISNNFKINPGNDLADKRVGKS